MSAQAVIGESALFLRARVLEDVPHGFSTRRGGVSGGAFASLNLGRQTGDEPSHVAENHRLLAEAAGYDPKRLATPARQVHGATVVRAATTAHADCDCDAVVSPADLVLGVRTADCVPVLLWHPSSGFAAAVHAGWRGVAASIVPAAVRAMDRDAASMRAAIGPAIGLCCYEVDDATAGSVRAVAPRASVEATRPGHVRIDLIAGVRGQLAAAGIPEGSIEAVGGCTSCDAERFFSHRRDRGTTGRHLSFITSGVTR